MLPLLIVRPEPGNAASVAAARSLGIAEVLGAPLFAIAPVAWQAPDPADYAAILAGSANLFRHGGQDLAALAPLPVVAVGAETARVARDAGFTVRVSGEGSLQDVATSLPAGRYLRLSGSDPVPLTLPEGLVVDTVMVYAAKALPLSGEAASMLPHPCVVALHSGEAARHFAQECTRLNLPRSTVQLACLAPRIAAMAGRGWQAVEISAMRRDQPLLALAAQMCKNV
ncbi:uroporphyrinogen-III synthase [Novosphingobium sp.]|uniref:uroporphyrinogen-III synthase n=1 Tax=Novosphingobium sp. TaxID=1874826 RepID=UPI002FDCD220